LEQVREEASKKLIEMQEEKRAMAKDNAANRRYACVASSLV
jgi:hypothetical protein